MHQYYRWENFTTSILQFVFPYLECTSTILCATVSLKERMLLSPDGKVPTGKWSRHLHYHGRSYTGLNISNWFKIAFNMLDMSVAPPLSLFHHLPFPLPPSCWLERTFITTIAGLQSLKTVLIPSIFAGQPTPTVLTISMFASLLCYYNSSLPHTPGQRPNHPARFVQVAKIKINKNHFCELKQNSPISPIN